MKPPSVPGWLPNAITIFRIVLVPVFVVLAAACQRSASGEGRWLCLLVLLLMGISDVLDGWLARRFGLGTALGATLDAFADKLAQVALLTFFTLSEGPAFASIPIWFVILVVIRDLWLGVGWLVIRRRRGTVEVVHEGHGKAASLLTFLLLLWITAGLPDPVIEVAVWGIGAIVLTSAIAYVRKGLRQFRRGAA